MESSAKRYARYLMVIAGLGGVLYGFAGGSAFSIALPYIERTLGFSKERLSILVATGMFGGVVSSFLAGPLAEWFGRRRPILVSALVFAMGSPVICFSGGSYAVMFSGLLLQGLAMGVLGVVVPMYLAECLDANTRGKGTAFFQLLLIVGIFFTGLVGLGIAYALGAADAEAVSQAAKTHAWQALFWSECIPALVLFFGAFWLRESPRWLYRRGRADEALASLAANNGEAKAGEILAEMRAADEKAAADKAALASAKKDTLFQRKYVVPFAIAVIVLACNQTTGINAVLGYSVKIFQEAGLSGALANWADTLFKVAMLAMTALACVLVETKGRKFLLKVGTSGIIVGLVGAGTAFSLIRSGVVAAGAGTGAVVLVSIVIFISAFSVGPGVCVWLALTELMPNRIRAVGMSVALLINQGISMSLQAVFLPLVDRIGYGSLFFVLAACTVVYFVTAAFFMPETKGRTLEEIESFFEGKKK